MPRVQDIINAATPGPWKWLRDSSGLDFTELERSETGYPVLSQSVQGIAITSKDADFIATFDPAHVALMEAAIRTDIDRDAVADCVCEGCEAHRALISYRKERGLDG